MSGPSFGDPILHTKLSEQQLRSGLPLTLTTARRQRTMLLAISGIVAILAHAVFLLLLPAAWQKNQSSDYVEYYEPVAQKLAAGAGLVLGSKPALRYPPGIPMLYAATFWISDSLEISHGAGLHIFQALFVIASGVLVGVVAMRFLSLRIALAASILWSTYPFHLWLTKQPDASAIFTTLLLLGVFPFLLWSTDGCHAVLYGFLLGFILAIIALIKPFSIALPATFVGLAWMCAVPCRRRQRSLFSTCVLVAYLLLISPWEVWAWRVSGHWIPLCTNGPSALIDGLTFGTVRGLKQVTMPESVRTFTEDAVAHAKQLRTTTSIANFVVVQIRERPEAVIKLFLLKAVRSWYGNESHTLERRVAIIQLFYLPFVIFGMRIVWRGGLQHKNFLLVAMGITMYFWTMTAITALPILRYMVPIVSLLMVFAAAAVEKVAMHHFGPFLNEASRFIHRLFPGTNPPALSTSI
jgi:4-amino-4-deoxy-L-arabinose transferase-like glycosyltransferase